MGSTGKQIYLNGKVVGVVLERVFYRDQRDSHFLRTPPAIAFHVSVIEQLNAAGAELYVLTAIERLPLLRYIITAEHFAAKHDPFDRGYGLQHRVMLCEWQVDLSGTNSKPAEGKPAADKPAA